jgi:hypothetical protein
MFFIEMGYPEWHYPYRIRPRTGSRWKNKTVVGP